eukprot:6065378-Alexandrium_andersonii.AAC.1
MLRPRPILTSVLNGGIGAGAYEAVQRARGEHACVLLCLRKGGPQASPHRNAPPTQATCTRAG